MVRCFALCAVASALVVLPARAFAGGPPFLCLPVDGVTHESAPGIARFLSTKLDKFIWPNGPEQQRGVQILKRKGQWYLAFYLGDDIRMSDVKTALEERRCSLPLNRLRLFGHVILEVESQPEAQSALIVGVRDLSEVEVEEWGTESGLLLVTVDMAYPVSPDRRDLESVGWETFQRNGLSSNQVGQPTTPIKLEELPSYESIRATVAKHQGKLKDVRWNANFACRALGGVARP
jgi:hypothetical protein